jgi:hypothetical protein
MKFLVNGNCSICRLLATKRGRVKRLLEKGWGVQYVQLMHLATVIM